MTSNELNLENMNAEQLAKLEQQIEARKKNEKERILRERECYTDIVDAAVCEAVKKLQNLSSQMAVVKADIFASFETIITTKEELFKVKLDRKSDTFSTRNGDQSITLGHRTVDAYNDTVDAGIAKVKEYISTLARDENSAALVDTVMGLLSKNRKGELKASRVLELEKLAARSGSEDFIEGINIIKAAYTPSCTCQFIEVKIKDKNGKEITLPLSVSAM